MEPRRPVGKSLRRPAGGILPGVCVGGAEARGGSDKQAEPMLTHTLEQLLRSMRTRRLTSFGTGIHHTCSTFERDNIFAGQFSSVFHPSPKSMCFSNSGVIKYLKIRTPLLVDTLPAPPQPRRPGVFTQRYQPTTVIPSPSPSSLSLSLSHCCAPFIHLSIILSLISSIDWTFESTRRTIYLIVLFLPSA